MARLADIHRAARRGDIGEMKKCLASGAAIDQPDTQQGHTPLMHACLSPEAPPAAVAWLIEQGADVNGLTTPPGNPMDDLDDDLKEELEESMAATLKEMGESMDVDPKMMEMLEELPQSSHQAAPESVLLAVIREASMEKLKLLIASGADVSFLSESGYNPLIIAACSCREDAMKLLLEAGSPTDAVSSFGESALARVSGTGHFDLVRLLLGYDADPSPLEWTPLMRAAAVGSDEEVRSLIKTGVDFEATDRGGRNALQLTIVAGRLPLAEWLIDQGATLPLQTTTGTPTLELVIPADQDAALRWLLDRGFDPNSANEFGTTPLMNAAEYGSVRCFQALTEAGADWKATDHIDESVLQKASDLEIVGILIAGGEDPGKLETEVLREFIGLGTADVLEVTLKEFHTGRQRRFGKTNPEPVNIPFWDGMVRTGWNAYEANDQFDLDAFESEGATWCHDRFGMSLTCLPDGRFVQIAGEHEDGYDPDFCIYNDVIVHDGKGGIQIYAYPEDLFPPSDFHSATLIGSCIYLIGSLSYPEYRKAKAQVLRLNTETWSMEAVATIGDDPGWIHGHRAEILHGKIHVSGGKLWVPDGEESGEIVENPSAWEFDPQDASWRRL